MIEIPKFIHYCWFGGNPLPESAQKCINSWHEYFPDYDIIEWNESNFNINLMPYTKEAYDVHKYAFVSDVARFWILFHFGGIYFDTDVEVIKPMFDIIDRGCFLGIEVPSDGNNPPLVAPGLGMGAAPGMDFYKNVLDYYNTIHFIGDDGNLNEVTVVRHTSKLLVEAGLKPSNEIQDVAGIVIYPVDYFNPLNVLTAELSITDNTRSIHWYSNSWGDKKSPFISWIIHIIHRYFGVNSLQWLKKLIGRK